MTWSLRAVATTWVLCGVGAVSAQVTQLYSFEPGLEGWMSNPQSVLHTVSLNTDTNFVSEGVQSMKIDMLDFASFEGFLTSQVDLGILNDPPGVDFIRFDFINTNRFVPDNPVAGTDPTFANISINVFGEFASNPGVIENIQFFGSEVAVGALEPATHEIEIDVTDGGLLIGSSTVQGFNDYIADGLTVSSFQIYLNKSVGFSPPFAWTFYIDDIRAGMNTTGNGGDYNSDGLVNLADYTVWRDHLGGVGPEGDGTTTGDLLGVPDGVVDEWDYDFWRQNLGNFVPAGGTRLSEVAVPEPGGFGPLLLSVVGFCWRGRKRVVGAE